MVWERNNSATCLDELHRDAVGEEELASDPVSSVRVEPPDYPHFVSDDWYTYMYTMRLSDLYVVADSNCPIGDGTWLGSRLGLEPRACD